MEAANYVSVARVHWVVSCGGLNWIIVPPCFFREKAVRRYVMMAKLRFFCARKHHHHHHHVLRGW